MLTLYGYPRSSNALKVRFLLEELGLSYEHELVPVEEPRPASYVALNPLGKVPTLVDDGILLTESHAILRYLARREGRHDLYGPTPGEAAHVDEWLDRFALVLRPAFFAHEKVALHYEVGKGFFPELGDPVAALERAARIAPTLRQFDALVSPSGAVLGRFTIGDCAIAPVLYRTLRSGLDLTPYPNLLGLRETLVARAGFQSAGPVL
ncbi:MAG: glutathione S-transferase family protein [Gaiellales bacterium]